VLPRRARPSRRGARPELVLGLIALACSSEPSSRPSTPAQQHSRDAAPSLIDAGPSSRFFPDLGAAVEFVLAEETPRIVGFGEVHQLVATQGTRSSLSRFTADVLPVLVARGASNLVLETWVERPSCGAVQQKVDTEIRQETQRPEATQSELVVLLEAVDRAGLGRHGMSMSCDEYSALLGDAGTVDYGRLLSLITEKLRDKAVEVAGKAPADSIVFLYGGSLHNDRAPNEGVQQWSYVPAVEAAVGGRFVEIDILVPELIAGDSILAKEPWFGLARSADLDRGVLLVRRGERSYVLLARRGVANPRVSEPSQPPRSGQ